MEINIGPKINPIKPKTFNPKIIPNTEFSGWMFSILFKKVNLRILSTPAERKPKNRTPAAPTGSWFTSNTSDTGT